MTKINQNHKCEMRYKLNARLRRKKDEVEYLYEGRVLCTKNSSSKFNFAILYHQGSNLISIS